MDLLTATLACTLFVAAPASCNATPDNQPAAEPAAMDRIAQWDGFIGEASQRFAIPDDWIRSVMAQESGGRIQLNGKPITSPKGAMGLMQLMPQTWQDIRLHFGLGNDPYDPHDNILAGAAYLRAMQDRFGTSGMFAAYNAGPGRFTKYLEGLRPLPVETQNYVAKIASPGPKATKQKSHVSLFFAISADSTARISAPESDNSAPATTVSARDLFVPLSRRAP